MKNDDDLSSLLSFYIDEKLKDASNPLNTENVWEETGTKTSLAKSGKQTFPT